MKIKMIEEDSLDLFMSTGNFIKICLIKDSEFNEMLFKATREHKEIPLSINDIRVMVKVSKITAKEDYFEWVLRIT
jgi:hypothetical protein